MNKLTYSSEYVDGLIADFEQAIALRDNQIAELESHNRACDDILGRLVGQFGASGLHAIGNSLNPAQALFYDALQVMKRKTLPLPAAITDIIAERQRQQSAEGWTPEHDDKYQNHELIWAATTYACNTINPYGRIPFDWPWDSAWWKPTNPRRDLVKAGALIAAEIERIDRAASKRVSLPSPLAPSPVNRDECGLWTHPEYSALFGDRDGISEAEFNAWCDARSVVSALSYLDSDDDQHDVRDEYFNNGQPEVIARWNPKPPEGEGWFLGSIHDSEDGPVAVWFCNKSITPSPEATAIARQFEQVKVVQS